MQSTKNYNLVKQELTDAPDITQIASNWDKIDTEMKKLSDDKFDKTGGTVSGATTFEKGTTTKGGATVDTLTVTGGTTTNTLNVKGTSTLTGDVTIDGKVITDNVRAKGQSLNVGVTQGGTELVGFIAQLVGGTTPRLSVTHHPDKASNDKQVATTNWVKSLTATQSEYGLVKLATEEDIIECDPQAVVHTPMMYEINDFRRVNTAYELEEKVACAFEYEYFLECTKAGTTSGDLLDTRNVTFGQVITDGTVEWTVRAHVRSINGAVADEHGNVEIKTGLNESDIKRVVLDTFFPVGTVYTDVTGNINPNAQFGGTWVKIENAFLYGSGNKAIGATGGAETHTLTQTEMPSHSHGLGTQNVWGKVSTVTGYESTFEGAFRHVYTGNIGGQSGRSGFGVVDFNSNRNQTGASSNTGSNGAHNNMPPYLVVSIWKRIS